MTIAHNPPFYKLNLHRCAKLFSKEAWRSRQVRRRFVILSLFQDDEQRQCVVLKQVQDDGVWFGLPPLFSSFPLRLCVKQSGTTPAQKSNRALQTAPFYLLPFVAFMKLA